MPAAKERLSWRSSPILPLQGVNGTYVGLEVPSPAVARTGGFNAVGAGTLSAQFPQVDMAVSAAGGVEGVFSIPLMLKPTYGTPVALSHRFVVRLANEDDVLIGTVEDLPVKLKKVG